MIAYVTTIGEQTTDLCVWQLQRLEFEVVVIDGMEPWVLKYRRFITAAKAYGGPCIRIDADVIVNADFVVELSRMPGSSYIMAQWQEYCLYKNGLTHASPVWYAHEALEIIHSNLENLDPIRPETSAWRLPEINEQTKTWDGIVGFHGFFQDQAAIARAKHNKQMRGQEGYDWELVERIKAENLR